MYFIVLSETCCYYDTFGKIKNISKISVSFQTIFQTQTLLLVRIICFPALSRRYINSNNAMAEETVYFCHFCRQFLEMKLAIANYSFEFRLDNVENSTITNGCTFILVSMLTI